MIPWSGKRAAGQRTMALLVHGFVGIGTIEYPFHIMLVFIRFSLAVTMTCFGPSIIASAEAKDTAASKTIAQFAWQGAEFVVKGGGGIMSDGKIPGIIMLFLCK
jgi:hypothetical protein